MKCQRLQADLSAYLDGELTPLERDNIEKHLASCSGCAARLDQLRRISALAGDLPRVLPPPDAIDQVTLQIERQSLFVVTEKPRKLWPRLAAGGLAAAALVFLVVCSWGWLGKLGLYRSQPAERELAVGTTDEAREPVLAAATTTETPERVLAKGPTSTVSEAVPFSPAADGAFLRRGRGAATGLPAEENLFQDAFVAGISGDVGGAGEEKQLALAEAPSARDSAASLMGSLADHDYDGSASEAERVKSSAGPAGPARRGMRMAGRPADLAAATPPTEPATGWGAWGLRFLGVPTVSSVQARQAKAETPERVLAELHRAKESGPATGRRPRPDSTRNGPIQLVEPHVFTWFGLTAKGKADTIAGAERTAEIRREGIALRINTSRGPDVEALLGRLRGQGPTVGGGTEVREYCMQVLGVPWHSAEAEAAGAFVLRVEPEHMWREARNIRQLVLAVDPGADVTMYSPIVVGGTMRSEPADQEYASVDVVFTNGFSGERTVESYRRFIDTDADDMRDAEVEEGLAIDIGALSPRAEEAKREKPSLVDEQARAPLDRAHIETAPPEAARVEILVRILPLPQQTEVTTTRVPVAPPERMAADEEPPQVGVPGTGEGEDVETDTTTNNEGEE